MRAKANRENWITAQCAYCGDQTLTNEEHVIARSLYLREPKYPVSVRSCEKCHDEKSINESNIREFLLNESDSFAAASEKQIQKFLSSMEKDRSQYSLTYRRIISGASPGDDVEYDFTRLNIGVKFIVRGLQYFETGSILLASTPMTVHYCPAAYSSALIEFIDTLPHIGPHAIGDNDTWWQLVLPDPSDPIDDTSYTLISLWSRALFLVIAGSEAIANGSGQDDSVLRRFNAPGSQRRLPTS